MPIDYNVDPTTGLIQNTGGLGYLDRINANIQDLLKNGLDPNTHTAGGTPISPNYNFDTIGLGGSAGVQPAATKSLGGYLGPPIADGSSLSASGAVNRPPPNYKPPVDDTKPPVVQKPPPVYNKPPGPATIGDHWNKPPRDDIGPGNATQGLDPTTKGFVDPSAIQSQMATKAVDTAPTTAQHHGITDYWNNAPQQDLNPVSKPIVETKPQPSTWTNDPGADLTRPGGDANALTQPAAGSGPDSKPQGNRISFNMNTAPGEIGGKGTPGGMAGTGGKGNPGGMVQNQNMMGPMSMGGLPGYGMAQYTPYGGFGYNNFNPYAAWGGGMGGGWSPFGGGMGSLPWYGGGQTVSQQGGLPYGNFSPPGFGGGYNMNQQGGMGGYGGPLVGYGSGSFNGGSAGFAPQNFQGSGFGLPALGNFGQSNPFLDQLVAYLIANPGYIPGTGGPTGNNGNGWGYGSGPAWGGGNLGAGGGGSTHGDGTGGVIDGGSGNGRNRGGPPYSEQP